MSGNRKFYEALAQRTAEVSVEVTAEDFVPTIKASDAWGVFSDTSHCKVCDNPTSKKVLGNLGGVCIRCHYQHRWE